MTYSFRFTLLYTFRRVRSFFCVLHLYISKTGFALFFESAWKVCSRIRLKEGRWGITRKYSWLAYFLGSVYIGIPEERKSASHILNGANIFHGFHNHILHKLRMQIVSGVTNTGSGLGLVSEHFLRKSSECIIRLERCKDSD